MKKYLVWPFSFLPFPFFYFSCEMCLNCDELCRFYCPQQWQECCQGLGCQRFGREVLQCSRKNPGIVSRKWERRPLHLLIQMLLFLLINNVCCQIQIIIALFSFYNHRKIYTILRYSNYFEWWKVSIFLI